MDRPPPASKTDDAERARVPRPAATSAPSPGRRPGLGSRTGSLLDGLDPEQRAAATADGPLLIIAGPGSGKTRTLTYRIAHQVSRARPARGRLPGHHVHPAGGPGAAGPAGRAVSARAESQPTVTTFHGLGLRILREHHAAAGLPPGFRVADETVLLQVATELAGSERDARKLIADPDRRPDLRRALADRELIDFDGLIELPAALLREQPEIAAALRARWPRVSVDEYQDIDPVQYELLRLISGDGAGLTAIGDPDQAIYGFRGADVGIFGRFAADFPGATTVELTRNYRSNPGIVTAAGQAIAPSTLVPGRTAIAARGADPRASSPWTRRPTSTPRRAGSPPPSTSSSAARRSIPWTAAGPTGTSTARSGWPTSPSSTAPTPRPGRSPRP